MAKKRVDKGVPGMDLLVCRNPKAAKRYDIEERLEAGMVLYGTEVKSLRARRANLEAAYCRIDDDELFLYGMHIAPYERGGHADHARRRARPATGLFQKRRCEGSARPWARQEERRRPGIDSPPGGPQRGARRHAAAKRVIV